MTGPRAYWRCYGAPWTTIIGSGRWFPLAAEWPAEMNRGLDAGLTQELVRAGVPRPVPYSVRELGPLTLTRGEVQVSHSRLYGV